MYIFVSFFLSVLSLQLTVFLCVAMVYFIALLHLLSLCEYITICHSSVDGHLGGVASHFFPTEGKII